MASYNEQEPEQPPLAENVKKPAMLESEPLAVAAGVSQSSATSGDATPAVAVQAGGLSLEDFILLNEEIAGMARAGLPLDQGLAALAREMGGGRLRSVTAQIAVDLKSGFTLPQAVERQAGRVPAYYATLLGAGIRSGRIGDVISTLTVYARTLADLRNTAISALCYPTIVLVMSLAIFAFMSLFLMPQFKSIFQNFGIRTPLFTQIAFFIFERGLWIFVVAPLLVLGAGLFVRFLVRLTAAGRRNWARAMYAVPIVGEFIRSARLAAFADLMGILVDNSVPLPEAFLLAGQSSSDPLMAAGAQQVHERLSQGIALGTVLREQRLVPEVVAWMVALGEKRGSLGPTLHQVGEMYRRQVEMRAGLLRGLLPPLLLIFIAGFVVATFILAVFLPLLALISGLGGG